MPRGHPVVLANGSEWPNKRSAENHFRSMRDRWPRNVVIDAADDHDDLCALLERYDETITTGPSKTGCGVDHFVTRENSVHGGISIGFWVIRTDRSETDFSFIDAVAGLPRNTDAQFVEACRESVFPELMAAKEAFFRTHGDVSGQVPCAVTGHLISFDAARVDHAPKTLRDLAWEFRLREGWGSAIPDGIISRPLDAQLETTFVDMNAMVRFTAFHRTHATLRMVSKSVLRSRLLATRAALVRLPVAIS
ncbi:MAG: DUF3223 domain-containing protein [Mesorhizobium sp.]|nr:MAG: DUF3223 domain-containing protein [Mesorhizobium sp.]